MTAADMALGFIVWLLATTAIVTVLLLAMAGAIRLREDVAVWRATRHIDTEHLTLTKENAS